MARPEPWGLDRRVVAMVAKSAQPTGRDAT